MKKLTLLLLAVVFATSAFAQEFSVGLRLGSGVQAVGQYKYNDKCYIEARFGASWLNRYVSSYDIDYGGDSIGYNGTEGFDFMDMTTRAASVRTHYDAFVTADFTVLHNWRVFTMDWTPSYGDWFFDAGVGVNVGGKEHFAYVGLAGMARLGFNFPDVPITLSADWTPVVGPNFVYGKGWREASYNTLGLANLAVTCTYNF